MAEALAAAERLPALAVSGNRSQVVWCPGSKAKRTFSRHTIYVRYRPKLTSLSHPEVSAYDPSRAIAISRHGALSLVAAVFLASTDRSIGYTIFIVVNSRFEYALWRGASGGRFHMRTFASYAGAFASKIILTALMLGSGVCGASAVTYDYLGQNYDTPNPNSYPAYFGDHMVASITLNCSPCSGTYFLNDAAVTSFTLSTGPYSAPASALAAYAASNFVTFSSGNITAWHIYMVDYPSTYAPASGVPWGQEVILTVDNYYYLNVLLQLGDNYSTFLGAQSAANHVAGTWSLQDIETVPLPTALPLFTSGLGAIGLLVWRRRRIV